MKQACHTISQVLLQICLWLLPTNVKTPTIGKFKARTTHMYISIQKTVAKTVLLCRRVTGYRWSSRSSGLCESKRYCVGLYFLKTIDQHFVHRLQQGTTVNSVQCNGCLYYSRRFKTANQSAESSRTADDFFCMCLFWELLFQSSVGHVFTQSLKLRRPQKLLCLYAN